MAAKYTEYHFQLINKRTGEPIDDDACDVQIMTAGTPAAATVYSNDSGTSLTTPTTTTDGALQFFTTSDVTTVDITGMTTSGIPFFVRGLTPSQHRVIIDTEQYTGLVFVVPWTFSASTSVVTTSLDLRTENLVKDIEVIQTTAAGATSDVMCVGTSTDTSGFAANVTTQSTGYKVVEAQSSASLVQTVTYTGLLRGYLLHTETTNTHSLKRHRVANSTSGARIVFKSYSGTGATGAGYIYLHLDRLVIN